MVLERGAVDKVQHKVQWIKDLAKAEQQMEESGIIDFSAGMNANELLANETIDFLKDLKMAFIETSSAFNDQKSSSLGQVKLYGISKTIADFMLFRNGYKLIFALKSPGVISISFNHIGNSFIPGAQAQESNSNSDHLVAKWGAFGQLIWTFKDQRIQLDYLVRYYFTRFIKESAK